MARYTNYDDLLKKWHELGLDEISKIHKVNAFNHFIKTLPIADVVEVKHGKWKIKVDEYDCEYMMCSVCKEEFYPFDEDTVDTTPNYCMNCGAKMDVTDTNVGKIGSDAE